MARVDLKIVYKPDFGDTPDIRLDDVLVSLTSDGILIQEVSIPSLECSSAPKLDDNGFINLEWSRRSTYLNKIVGSLSKIWSRKLYRKCPTSKHRGTLRIVSHNAKCGATTSSKTRLSSRIYDTT